MNKFFSMSLKGPPYSGKKITGQFESNNKSKKLKSEKSFSNKCFVVKQRSIQI